MLLLISETLYSRNLYGRDEEHRLNCEPEPAAYESHHSIELSYYNLGWQSLLKRPEICDGGIGEEHTASG